MEEIFLDDKGKIVSKMYKCLIRIYTRRNFKIQMIRWAENVNENILSLESVFGGKVKNFNMYQTKRKYN